MLARVHAAGESAITLDDDLNAYVPPSHVDGVRAVCGCARVHWCTCAGAAFAEEIATTKPVHVLWFCC